MRRIVPASSDEGASHVQDEASESSLEICDQAATFVNRGIVRIRTGSRDRAAKDHDAALAHMPELAAAYGNKGMALVHAGGDKARSP